MSKRLCIPRRLLDYRGVNMPSWYRQRGTNFWTGRGTVDRFDAVLTLVVYRKCVTAYPWFRKPYAWEDRTDRFGNTLGYFAMGKRPVKGIHSHNRTRKYARKVRK